MTTLEKIRAEIARKFFEHGFGNTKVCYEVLQILDKYAEQEQTNENLHREREQAYMQGYEDASKKYRQEPNGDVVSRQAVLDLIDKFIIPIPTMGGRDLNAETNSHLRQVKRNIEQLPPVRPQEQKTGHCKDCKYFEYDSVAKVDGVPLIVAHEICNKWGDGCKTKEDGYCYLFEPQKKQCADCSHYGKLSLDCGRCDDDCSMYEPEESEESE